MKTIIENETKLSKYLLDDDTPVAFINGQIHVGEIAVPANTEGVPSVVSREPSDCMY